MEDKMTNQEAIEYLTDFKDKSWDGMPEEVIDMAIKALSAFDRSKRIIQDAHTTLIGFWRPIECGEPIIQFNKDMKDWIKEYCEEE